MHNKIKDFLKEINNGKIRGSRKVIADALGINETAISKWAKGRTHPSKENIAKMAEVFKKSQKEIEDIFLSGTFIQDNDIEAVLEENINLKKELDIRGELINFLREKNKNLEKEIEALKKH